MRFQTSRFPINHLQNKFPQSPPYEELKKKDHRFCNRTRSTSAEACEKSCSQEGWRDCFLSIKEEEGRRLQSP